MDPPELPVTPGREITARMHHEDIIRDHQVSLLPRVEIRHPAVMQEAVQHRAQGVVVLEGPVLVLDGHVGRVEGRLGLRPGLVVPQARLARRGVVDDQGQAAQLGRVEGRRAHAPGQLAQVVEVQVLWEVLPDEGGAGEEREACVLGGARDAGEELESEG